MLTEEYRCPLTGDKPRLESRHADDRRQYAARKADILAGRVKTILVPGKVLPPGATNADIEHEVAMRGDVVKWSRLADGGPIHGKPRPAGSVVLWVEM